MSQILCPQSPVLLNNCFNFRNGNQLETEQALLTPLSRHWGCVQWGWETKLPQQHDSTAQLSITNSN